VPAADPCSSTEVVALPQVFFDVVTGDDASRVIATGADASHHISLFSNGTLLEDGEIVGSVEASGCVRNREGELVARWTEDDELRWTGDFARDFPLSISLVRGVLVMDTPAFLDRMTSGFVDREIHTTHVACRDDLCEDVFLKKRVDGGVRVYPTAAQRRLALELWPLPDVLRMSAQRVVE
jgi:hypothetical protein